MSSDQKGFTLIELLIVIAILAILAAVVFVALDPLTRFKDSRDATRASDAGQILQAIKVYQIDEGGHFPPNVYAMTTGQVYMIGTATSACDDQNSSCDTNVDAGDTGCVDLGELVSAGYLASVPKSPNGAGTWTTGVSGYTLYKSATSSLIVRSCESENTTEISASQ